MAVVRMKNVTLAFSREELEKVHLDLISSNAFEPLQFHEIMGSEVSKELSGGENVNPYQDLHSEMLNFLRMTEYDPPFEEERIDIWQPLDIDDSLRRFRLMNDGIRSFFNKKNELNKKLQDYRNVLFHVKILADLRIGLQDFEELKRVKLIFGRVPIRSYEALVESSLSVPVLVLEVSRDKDSSWIFVFTTPDFKEDAYKILQSAYFEEDKLPVDYSGTPHEIRKRMEALIELTKISIEENDFSIKKVLYANKEFIDEAYPIILAHKRVYDLAAFDNATPEKNLYFVSGWMPEDDVKNFAGKFEGNALMIDEAAEKVIEKKKVDVPVKLKNRGFLFKGYEFITEMFGTPSYGEIDPTPFVAAFFIFMYGFMLGDIGHGSILFLFGLFIYKKSSKKFGTVMMSSALSSVFFGIMYGSVFGFEGWIPAVWLRPIIQINQLLVISVYFGIGMIIFGMAVNIVNGFRQKNWEKAIFSAEGIAGLVFYVPAVMLVSFYLISGKSPFNTLFISVVFLLSLLAMFFKKPLGQLVSHEKVTIPDGFWVEAGFGMFDTLIQFLSNAISYVRLAAFALTHEALFLAFWVMATMVLPSPGGQAWAFIIFILGQFMLVGLEGLVVFIQDLRLVYYEFFTKFFEANGKEFRPFLFKGGDVE